MASPPRHRRLRFDTNSVTIRDGPIQLFDDSAWPGAENGLVPSRSRDTNRFLWVRIRVPVPGNLNGPLALHLDDLGVQPMTWQVFAQRTTDRRPGDLPPPADPADPPVSPVMTLPSSLAPPGSAALVAVREWDVPAFLESGVPSRPTAVINEAAVLSLTVRAGAAEALVANGPEYALSALLALAGIALLVFWRSSRGREYLWAAIMLLSPLATAMLSSGLVTARLSFHAQALAKAAVYTAGLIAEIEFMWALFQLRSRWIHILWHAIWVAFILAEIAEAYFLEAPAFEHLCQIVIIAGIAAFDCILFPVCIREMFRPGGNRAIAAAQTLMEVIIALGALGYSVHLHSGHSRWISASRPSRWWIWTSPRCSSGGHGRHGKKAALCASSSKRRVKCSSNWLFRRRMFRGSGSRAPMRRRSR